MAGLSHVYGKDSILLCQAGMNTDQKETILDRFAEEDDQWIMLCAFGSISVGANLQRANYAIMLEPSHTPGDITQYFARVDRVGQKQPMCYGYILVNSASSIEGRMMKSIEFNEDIRNAIFKQKDMDELDNVQPEMIDDYEV